MRGIRLSINNQLVPDCPVNTNDINEHCYCEQNICPKGSYCNHNNICVYAGVGIYAGVEITDCPSAGLSAKPCKCGDNACPVNHMCVDNNCEIPQYKNDGEISWDQDWPALFTKVVNTCSESEQNVQNCICGPNTCSSGEWCIKSQYCIFSCIAESCI